MDVRKELLLTARECAEILNISRASLSRLVVKGAIGFYRIGFKTMFSGAHIDAYLQSVEGNRAHHCSPHNKGMGEVHGQV